MIMINRTTSAAAALFLASALWLFTLTPSPATSVETVAYAAALGDAALA